MSRDGTQKSDMKTRKLLCRTMATRARNQGSPFKTVTRFRSDEEYVLLSAEGGFAEIPIRSRRNRVCSVAPYGFESASLIRRYQNPFIDAIYIITVNRTKSIVLNKLKPSWSDWACIVRCNSFFHCQVKINSILQLCQGFVRSLSVPREAPEKTIPFFMRSSG